MGKDLRTTAVEMKLQRYGKIDTSAWGLKTAQPFFPSLERLFKTETVPSLSEYGIRLSQPISSVVDKDSVRTTKGKIVPIHRKTTMLLSPFKWMRGDYGDLSLPKPSDIAKDIQKNIQSSDTAGYVGALTSIALSESDCIHFPKVYGVYVGLAEKHTIDISDDYEDLSDRRWFGDNIGKTFDLKLRTSEGEAFQHTRGQRPNILVGEDIELEIDGDIEAEHISQPSSRSHTGTLSASSSSSFEEDCGSSENSTDVFEIRSCDCPSEDDNEEDVEEDDDEEDEPFAWATFSDVPVITTVMEKCEGTFYDLLTKYRSDSTKHSAWVAQIVFALAYAQRMFGFVHNDLHGNNVMYVSTQQEYLYYKHGGVSYRVPTYGYIMKIIDFDRATLSLRLLGMKEPRHFLSNQFHPDEEAAGQYNMEPFFDHAHPHIPACSSFDLCRFATSVFWDMFPNGPDHPTSHPLFSVFQQWMEQTDGTSVMFRAKRDNHDRYHGFDLYKAIARYCKNAVPRKEISKLDVFKIQTVPLGSPCLFIEN